MSTERIWREFNQRLLSFIKTKITDEQQAKDLLQDVFIKIHLNVTSLQEEEKLISWLYQITRNTIIDFYKKKKSPFTELNMDLAISDETEENHNQRFFNCLEPFVAQLDPVAKEALEETKYGSSSQKDYAIKHDISYTAAKSRIQRARKKLQEAFLDCCLYEADKYGNIISANPNCDHRNC